MLEPRFDSSEEYSYEDASGEDHDHVVRRKSKWPRYDSMSAIPHFFVGMTFRGKEQMKKLVLKYGIATNRHIIFFPRMRVLTAKCSWPGCPWLIYGAKRSKCDWFQVVTLCDEHNCPPRRDNRLVTAQVIADKYEHFIKANPTWKAQSLQQTVPNELLADVTLSKCKRAKAIVMNKMLDGTKDEYSKIFDYQLELLRSNPGRKIDVALEPEVMFKHVFQKFYVCFSSQKGVSSWM